MDKTPQAPIVIFDADQARQPAGQCDCDCDCACTIDALSLPETLPANPSLLLEKGTLKRAEPNYCQPLDEDFSLYYSPRHRPVVLNRAAQYLLENVTQSLQNLASLNDIDFNAINKLFSAGLLTSDETQFPQISTASTTLMAWIHLTDRCNLRCVYCYLPHHPEDMSLETGKSVLRSVFRSAEKHTFQKVKLKFAGGEPLLRFDLLLDLQKEAQALAVQTGLALESVVLSNGTLLTPEVVQAMLKSELHLMISLDGLDADHDVQRCFANGRGSFIQVAQAVQIALEGGLIPDISVTISRRNIHGQPGLVAWLRERNLPFSFNFYRENKFSEDFPDLQISDNEMIEGLLAAYKVLEANLPDHNLLPVLVDRANLAMPHLHTCSVGRNYLVFDARGRVSACHMEMTHPVANLDDSQPLETIRSQANIPQNPSVEDKPECATCQWKYWCTGGCPLLAYHTTGSYQARSPYCAIYQALYPEAFRLEGLRLLKQYNQSETPMH